MAEHHEDQSFSRLVDLYSRACAVRARAVAGGHGGSAAALEADRLVEAAFAALFRRLAGEWRGPVEGFFAGAGIPLQGVDDLLQTLVLRFAHADRVGALIPPSGTGGRAWRAVIARRACIDRWRRWTVERGRMVALAPAGQRPDRARPAP